MAVVVVVVIECVFSAGLNVNCCCWCVNQSSAVVGFLLGLGGFGGLGGLGLNVTGLSHDGGLGFVTKLGSVVKCQCCCCW